MKKNMVIPHEHGGWAMVSIPFLFGIAAGTPQWMHFLLFLAWFFLYLASYPFLKAVKRSKDRKHFIQWGTLYGCIALVCVILPLLQNPSLFYFAIPLILLLIVNIWHAKRKSEREFINDLCAIHIFSLGGAAAYLIGDGDWDETMAMVVIFNFMYFMGTVFFVKTVFRKRGNTRWLTAAYIYHVLLLILPWILGYPWMTLSYIFAAARTFFYGGKQLRPMKVGIIEVIGSILFLLISLIVIECL